MTTPNPVEPSVLATADRAWMISHYNGFGWGHTWASSPEARDREKAKLEAAYKVVDVTEWVRVK